MSFKASTNHQFPAGSAEATETEEHRMEQLQLENSALHEEIETQAQENALLNEVISTVCSTLRLEEVLQHLVDTVVRATACQIAYIYLYDKEKERLVLASTTEQYRHLIGKLSMALGDGIAGWVALHQQAVFLKDDAMDDPRFVYFPELEEEKFQSIMTVPVIAKDRNLVGVITVQAIAPHDFTEQHRVFITNTAALVAGAIENAQLYENTQRKLSTLTSLSVLSQTISSGLYLDDMLRSLAALTVQIMEVDLCVVMLLEQVRERDIEALKQPRRLTVHASSPHLNERVHFQAIDVDHHTIERLHEFHEATLLNNQANAKITGQNGQYAMIGDETLQRLNPVRDSQYKALLSAPLIAGAEQLGLINCYSNKSKRFTLEDQTLLITIANQAAIAIKNSYLVNQLAQKNLVKGFFDDLMHQNSESEDSLKQRAHFLGCDLSRAHAIVMVEIAHLEERFVRESAKRNPKGDAWPASHLPPKGDDEYTLGSLQNSYKRITGIVHRRVQDNFMGSIFHEHENLLTCLIPLGKDTGGARLKLWLQDLSQQMRSEYNILLSVGISNVCQQISDYRQGFAEAQEALQMGQNLNENKGEQPVVTHFNDLGVYRYLYKIAHTDNLRDVFQDQVAHIDDYDRRKNTDLLITLETYLECAGNLTRTSDRLYVHRNTLIQRLERLQSLCKVDLQDRSNWLTLQIAIKIYKLKMGKM
jgi:GAF domain-containing protein/sugar diacid utilization regulator